MKTEYEAKFYPVDKKEITERLENSGATLLQAEVKTIIAVFNKQANPQISAHYIRVRDEGDVIRMSAKIHAAQDGNVSDQKEADTVVQNFDSTIQILECVGLKRSGYQEKKRETWNLNGAEVVIDTWPGLEIYIEIEAESEEKVQQIAELLGFQWDNRIITSVVEIYVQKYNLSGEEVLEIMANLTFENNPFENLEAKH